MTGSLGRIGGAAVVVMGLAASTLPAHAWNHDYGWLLAYTSTRRLDNVRATLSWGGVSVRYNTESCKSSSSAMKRDVSLAPDATVATARGQACGTGWFSPAGNWGNTNKSGPQDYYGTNSTTSGGTTYFNLMLDGN